MDTSKSLLLGIQGLLPWPLLAPPQRLGSVQNALQGQLMCVVSFLVPGASNSTIQYVLQLGVWAPQSTWLDSNTDSTITHCDLGQITASLSLHFLSC